MTNDNILSEITETERILSSSKKEKYNSPIDMNLENWRELLMKQNTDFYHENKSIIDSINKKLITHFPKYNSNKRSEILKALNNAENVKFNLSASWNPQNSKEWFNDRLIIFILNDLGTDTRDALMEINALSKSANKHSIDFKAMIEQNIQLANDDNKHGMGSTKSILNAIMTNCS